MTKWDTLYSRQKYHTAACYVCPSVVTALEIMGPGYRTFAGMMICLFFAVALMILSLLAYIFNSWFTLALVTSVPFASLFR